MFPFHQSGELSFQVTNDLDKGSNNDSASNKNIYFNPKVEQSTSAASSSSHTYHAQYAKNTVTTSPNHANRRRPGRGRARGVVNDNNKGVVEGNDIASKRMMHKEIERQRRLEMSKLYSSLRSLLPVEYIRGKRSICDHVTEATRYIKDVEKNVEELKDKRDKLKGLNPTSEKCLHGDVGCSSSSSSFQRDNNVSIHTFSKAIEVEIFAPVREDVFALSRVLEVLIDEGLNVVNCVSSRVNQRWIIVIHCEVHASPQSAHNKVDDVSSIDTSQLQRRLMSVIENHVT